MEPYNGSAPFEAQSETSREAAASLNPVSLGILKTAILQLMSIQPMTCDMVEISTGMSHQTTSARIRELYLMGLIKKVGKGITRTGRRADAWFPTDEGMEKLKKLRK